jgi:hypothetical protein
MTTLNIAEWISAVFTAVIAVATIVYVTYTRRLWRETKASADAAKASADAAKVTADAAKKSADIAAELQQPILVVWVIRFVEPPVHPLNFNPLSSDLLDLQVMLKNLGVLSAMDIAIDGWTYLNEGSEQLNRLTNPGPLQVPPGYVIPVNFKVQMKLGRLTEGAVYRVKLEVRYSSPQGNKRYRYVTVRALNTTDRSFTVEHNHTELVK